jgi:diguanylate cyclase (GGDEF)-like protein/PAS domain S-box-containing protein
MGRRPLIIERSHAIPIAKGPELDVIEIKPIACQPKDFMANPVTTILDNLFDEAVYFVDTERRITFWNKPAERLTGFTAQEVIGSRCMDNILSHVDEQGTGLCQSGCPLARVMEDGVTRDAEVYLHHKDGYRIPIRARILPVFGSAGAIVGGIEIFTDRLSKGAMTERIQELERLALIDPLTQLSNRKHAESELAGLFKQRERLGILFGMLFIDIDHFKRINDSFGHTTGDLVLRMVARTLSSSVRDFETVGRWGGEEFVVLVRTKDQSDLFSLAERLRVLVSQSYIEVKALKVGVTISVGGTMASDGDGMTSLVRRADELLYRSKNGGRNRSSVG